MKREMRKGWIAISAAFGAFSIGIMVFSLFGILISSLYQIAVKGVSMNQCLEGRFFDQGGLVVVIVAVVGSIILALFVLHKASQQSEE